MKISSPKLRLHNLVYKCIFLITLSQYSLAGLEVFFDGKKFFYRTNNGKEIPIDMSLGSEITRFQETLIAPHHRKSRETLHCLSQDPTCNENEEKSMYWQSVWDNNHEPYHDLGTEIVEKELGGMVNQEHEHEMTRYDMLASLANKVDIEKPEDKINTIISMIKEDLEKDPCSPEDDLQSTTTTKAQIQISLDLFGVFLTAPLTISILQ